MPAHCPWSLQTDVVKAIARLIEFYKHESCGQCTPCREGERPGFLCGSSCTWVGHRSKVGWALDPE